MGAYHRWVSFARRTFDKKRLQQTVVLTDHIVLKNSFKDGEDEQEKGLEEIKVVGNDTLSSKKEDLSQKDAAAIKIQAFFRGYLARQAFRALKSVVKLQALVRGVQVRRQSRIALRCMHVLVRLQVTIRSRRSSTVPCISKILLHRINSLVAIQLSSSSFNHSLCT